MTAPAPPWTPAGRQDPFPWYNAMRTEAPVAYLPELNTYGVFGYDVVREALGDDSRFSVAGRVAVMPERQRRVSVVSDTLIGLDPPEHTRLRSLVMPAFRPAAVNRNRARIESLSAELLDAALPKGQFDVVEACARPLPELVIAEFLGIPPVDRPRFTRLSHVMERAVGQFLGHVLSVSQLVAAEEAFDEYASYVSRIVDDRRATPGEDFISDLIRARLEADRLSDHEILKMVILLNVAGATTTQTLLATALLELHRHPDAWHQLRADAELVPGAVDETLRFHGTTHAVSRVATEDTQLGGCAIPADATMLLFLAAANRDPAVFPDPDVFDIERKAGRHLAFASGAHYCVGAPLARQEAQVFLRQWSERVEAFHCPVGNETPVAWAEGRLSNVILDALPVHIDAYV